MKWRRASSVFLLVAYALGSFGALFTLAAPARAAGSESYEYHYQKGAQGKVEKALGGDGSNSILSDSYVEVTGGQFDKKVKLEWSATGPTDTPESPAGVSGQPLNSDGNFFYNDNKEYSCNGWDVNIALWLKPNDGNKYSLDKRLKFSVWITSAKQNGRGKLASDVPASCRPDNANFSDKPDPHGNYRTSAATSVGDIEPPAAGGAGTDDCASASVTLGWLLCPVIEIANKAIGFMVENVVLPLLNVQPIANNRDLAGLWSSIRLLANISFALIFFVIIFANTLSINISAYTIKKMLPRLVAAAILVQLSFLLASVAVDIGNVFGKGLADLINFTIQSAPGSAHKDTGFELLGGAITAALGVGLILTVGIPGIVLLAFAALISVLGVVITLVARQLIINVLVVLAPIALAAWVLPGTEKIFKTWYQNFIKLILMYPLIVLLLSVAQILTTASSGTQEGLQLLLGAIFPIVAFFMIPATFKMAGGIMSMTSGAILKRSAGLSKGLKGSSMAKNIKEDQHLKNVDRLGRAAGTRPGQFLLNKAPLGTQARFARNQTAVSDEMKKRLESSNYDNSDLRAFAEGKFGEVRNRTLKGLKGNATATAAVHRMMAEGGQYSGKMLASLNDQVSKGTLRGTQADQIALYARTGSGFGKIFEKNRVLAMANREAFQMDSTGKEVVMNLGAGGLSDEKRKAISGAVSGLSASELAKSTPDAAVMLGQLGKDGIGKINPTAITGLKSARLATTMTDSQRKSIAEAIDSYASSPSLTTPTVATSADELAELSAIRSNAETLKRAARNTINADGTIIGTVSDATPIEQMGNEGGSASDADRSEDFGGGN